MTYSSTGLYAFTLAPFSNKSLSIDLYDIVSKLAFLIYDRRYLPVDEMFAGQMHSPGPASLSDNSDEIESKTIKIIISNR